MITSNVVNSLPKVDTLGMLSSFGTAEIGSNYIDVDTGTPLFDALVKIITPIIAGVVIPAIRDAIKRRKEKRNHGNY